MNKIEYTIGCTLNSITINGKEISNIPIEELKKYIIDIISKVNDLDIHQGIIIDIVEILGKYENLGYCEQCGDTIDKYTYEF